MKEKIEKLIVEYRDKISQLRLDLASGDYCEQDETIESQIYIYSIVIDDLRQVL